MHLRRIWKFNSDSFPYIAFVGFPRFQFICVILNKWQVKGPFTAQWP